MDDINQQQIYKELRKPFSINYVNWKINSYGSNGSKAMITFHIDARAVQQRLNDVLGITGWSFTWAEASDIGAVHGTLEIRVDGVVVEKEDVGYANMVGTGQKSEYLKDAVSDSLKRCAVHVGVGQFLYALPALWIELDTEKQKYLSDKQNEYIKIWLADKLKMMNSKYDI